LCNLSEPPPCPAANRIPVESCIFTSLHLVGDHARLPGTAPGNPQPGDMAPGSSPGVAGTEGTRIRPAPFRHSGFAHSLPRSAVRLFSVIPAKAGIHVHRNEPAEDFPERGRNVSGTLQTMDMDPGSSPGVTGEEGGPGHRRGRRQRCHLKRLSGVSRLLYHLP
jgi:hypothetical protein